MNINIYYYLRLIKSYISVLRFLNVRKRKYFNNVIKMKVLISIVCFVKS